MNINTGRITQRARQFRQALKTKLWVRIVTGAVVALTIYSAGVDAGHKDNDPRHSGPGNTATYTELKGKWDGVGTMPDGTPFCMVGWPCEDGFLEANK